MLTSKVAASSGSSDYGSARNTFKGKTVTILSLVYMYSGGSSWGSDDYTATQNSEDHNYRGRPDSYHSATQESSTSQVSTVFHVHLSQA